MVLWEMLYRTIPFGDFSIAQIVGAVGYGRRAVRAVAAQGASTETTFLHEVVTACTQRESTRRPRTAALLLSLQENLKNYERRRSQRSTFEKLSDKTGTFASSLLSGGLQRNLLSGSQPNANRQAVVAEPSEGGTRMVRLDTGE